MGGSNYVLLFGVVVFSSASGALLVAVLNLLRDERTRKPTAAPFVPDADHEPKSSFRPRAVEDLMSHERHRRCQ